MYDKEAFDKDTEYDENTLTGVKTDGEHYELQCDNSFILLRNVERVSAPPTAGERVRFYGKGLGYPVRGWSVEGRVYAYMSAKEAEQQRVQAIEEADAKKAVEFAAGLAEFNARIGKLPELIQERITRFRAKNGWGPAFLTYELFVCEEAVKIAEVCETVEGVDEFIKLPTSTQTKMVSDQHSGNTFGMAVRLAHAYLKEPALLPRMHGALCALVGCEEYGCWAASQEAKRA